MISKTVRKLLAVSLAAIMAIGAAGCGNNGGETPDPGNENKPNENTPEPTKEPEVDPEYVVIKDANGNTVDLGGMQIIVRDWWSDGSSTDAKLEAAANAYDEARWEYVKWCEETYNFTIIEQAMGDWTSNPTDFTTYVDTMGDDQNYVFTLRQCGEIAVAANSGYAYDVATLDCLDFTEEKYQHTNIHFLSGNGTNIYAFKTGHPEPRGCLYFNKRLLEELTGLTADDMYDLQKEGKWTFDKFEEVLKQIKAKGDTNNDGILDIYPMVQDSAFFKSAVFSNGGQFIDKTADGKFFNDVESAETIEALNWAVKMWGEYQKPTPEGANWDWFFADFRNGNSVFMTGQCYMAGQDLKDMADDFGCLAFPKGPSASDYISYYEDNVMMLPSCYDAERAWKIAFAYDLYTQPISGFDTSDGWKSGYYGSMRDTRSVDETVQSFMDSSVLNPALFVPEVDLGADILWSLNATSSPAALTEAIRDAWNSKIEKVNTVK